MFKSLVAQDDQVARNLHRLGLELLEVRLPFKMTKFGLRGSPLVLVRLEALGGRWNEVDQVVTFDVWSQLAHALNLVDGSFHLPLK